MLNSGPVGEPIAGIWTLKYDRDHTWEFRRDGTFRMSEMKTAGYPASLRLTNGQAAVTWKGPNQTAEEWIVRKQGDQLLIVQGGISTTYTKRPNP